MERQRFSGMNGGAEGNRTPDLVIANDALYQLSYSPASHHPDSHPRWRCLPLPGVQVKPRRRLSLWPCDPSFHLPPSQPRTPLIT